MRESIACVGLWFALLIGFTGPLVTFVPGAEATWYGMGAGSAALMLLSVRWRVRVVSIPLVIGFLLFAWQGHRRDVKYPEQLRQMRQQTRLGIQKIERLEARVELARKEYEQTFALVKNGKAGPDELSDSSKHQLLAELALHSKKDDRVKARRDHLDRTRYAEKIAQEKKAAGSATQAVVDSTTDYRRDAEIRLAEAGEQPHPAKGKKERPEP